MVVAILKLAFGSVEYVRYVETMRDGVVKKLDMDDERLNGVKQKITWREMCKAYYTSHARHSYFYSYQLSRGGLEGLESAMNCDEEFFDGAEGSKQSDSAFGGVEVYATGSR
jgi:hypothetical protein